LTGGAIYQVENLEATTWSAVAADTSHSIVKQGIMLDAATLGITPPGTVGYSQVYLIEVQYADSDTGSTVLPYYNASNPAAPYSGPGNAGTAQNTVRKGIVAVQVKAGIAATTGTQLTPTADAGWIGLFAVTVANGASTVTSGNIAQLSSAPFLATDGKLPRIPYGVQSGEWVYAADTGTADALVVALSLVPSSLTTGMRINVKKGTSANATTTPTINVNGLGAVTITDPSGSALTAGALAASSMLQLIYDGTSFRALTSSVSPGSIIHYGTDSGAANALVVASPSPVVTALIDGLVVVVKVANANTGAATVNVASLGAKNIVLPNGVALLAGDLIAGELAVLIYDASNTRFQLATRPSNAQTPVFFSASSGSATSAPSGVVTTITDMTIGSSDVTTAAAFSGGIITITAPIAGVWLFGMQGAIASATASWTNKNVILKNGTTIAADVRDIYGTSDTGQGMCSIISRVVAGDAIKAAILQNTGSTQSVASGSLFWGVRLSA
jgi:hypothetical protein